MGNTSAKVIPMIRSRKDKNKVHTIVPAPLSPIAIWKNNMHIFMQTHITQLQNYTEEEINCVKRRLIRFEKGHGSPFKSCSNTSFLNAVAEITELFTSIGNWHVMNNTACDLVNVYMAQNRQSDLEEIAFVFCVLVIEPQIIRNETRWSWNTL
jgi:hypothetical protein